MIRKDGRLASNQCEAFCDVELYYWNKNVEGEETNNNTNLFMRVVYWMIFLPDVCNLDFQRLMVLYQMALGDPGLLIG